MADRDETLGAFVRLWRRFVQRGRPDYKWVVIGALWALAFVLGCIGFARRAELVGQTLSRLDIGYSALQLFTLESGAVDPPVPTTLEVARYLAPAVAAVTAVKALLLIFRQRYERWRLRRRRGHTIVCGLGSKGRLLVEGFLRRGQHVAVVERNPENENLESCRELGAVILAADAAGPEVLRQAGIVGARHLVAVTGDDGVNLRIAANARAARKSSDGPPLTAVVHLIDPDHCRLLRRQELDSTGPGRLRLRFFNVYQSGARRLLAEYPFLSGEPEEAVPAHLLVVGLGEMGRSVVLEAGHRWTPGWQQVQSKLRITVAAEDAEPAVPALAEQSPDLSKACHLEGHRVDIAGFGYGALEGLCRSEGMADVQAAYVCLEEDSQCLPAAVAVNRALAEAGADATTVAVLSQDGKVAALLEVGDGEEFARLHAFRLLEHTCTPEVVLEGIHERLAQALHDQYVRQQEEAGATRQDNPHLVPWDVLPEWLKESNRRQADHVCVKLKQAGCEVVTSPDWDPASFEFSSDEVERLARMEHQRWVTERRLEGWRVGPRRDDAEKTSPYLVDWQDLPEDVREVDRSFIRSLPRALAEVGLRIRRS
jgi:hypothetical protein